MFPYSNTHHRLSGYDYRSTGAYFITICTAQRRHIFGECKQGKMCTSLLGQIVERCWLDIPNHRSYIILDAFIVMPNHIHGIMFITEMADMVETGDASVAATKKIQGKSLSATVGSFKASVTKQAHDAGLFIGSPIWQRNYHDHIIRAETSLTNITNYIIGNPAQWQTDEYFSDHVV